MIRVTIVPKHGVNLYGKMVKKEVQLRRSKQGTLHRSASKQKGTEKWAHRKYKGWVWFQKCLGRIVVAEVQSRVDGGENQILESFVGFVDRHFRKDLVSVTVNYRS